MKKYFTICFILCSAIMILSAQSVFAYGNGWNGGCYNCHGTGDSSPLHDIHSGKGCTICHANPDGGTPDIKNCASCHVGDCEIINNSRTPHPSSCLSCHSDCEQQPPTCTYSISPSSKTFRASGGKAAISVSTENGCVWEAISSDPSWIIITSSNGSGSGRVRYTVKRNTGTARTGTIDIEGEIFTVEQAGRR